MRVKQIISNTVLLAGLLLLWGIASCVRKDVEPDQRILSDDLHPDLVAPFTQAELPDITANEMHQLHFSQEVECGSCHPSSAPLPADRATKVCIECHPLMAVIKPVWDNHCLACHHFTMALQDAADNPQKIAEALCKQCHSGEGEGGFLYGACAQGGKGKVVCNNCHSPHDKDEAPIAERCAECHPDHQNIRHLSTSNADCSLCHSAHKPTVTGEKVCTTCHGQAEHVMIHNIPDHPKDCLQCHEPHFTTIKLTHACQDCHEDLNYGGDLNQPGPHLDCRNCHNLDKFKFKGIATCAGCHPVQGAVLNDDTQPAVHQSCTGCHQEHYWTANAKRLCTKCHEPDQEIFEHRAEFHPKNCDACHNTHDVTGTPKSGNCLGCHDTMEGMPPFGNKPPEMHLVCDNCHDTAGVAQGQFDFVGIADSCQQCHFESAPDVSWDAAPGGHVECLGCHAPHTFQPADPADSCAVCHSDVAEAAPNELHQGCLNCHSGEHNFAFAGINDSCALCHNDVFNKAPNSTHQACDSCHDFDHSFAFTGAENSCDMCHSDVLDEAPNEMHQDCANCHLLDHSMKFAGTADSCEMCHSGLEAEHKAAGHTACLDCHGSHTFAPDYDACKMCHTDREEHYPAFPCSQCHKFKPGGVWRVDKGLPKKSGG